MRRDTVRYARPSPRLDRRAPAGRNQPTWLPLELTEGSTSTLATVADQTRIVFSEGLTLIVNEELGRVRTALAQYEGGQAFPEFKSATGEDVCVASAHVAYIEPAPLDGEQPLAAD
jgi:hypothetical protein